MTMGLVPVCLASAGTEALAVHHQSQRFWPFQLIESAIVLALAALAAAGRLGLRCRMT